MSSEEDAPPRGHRRRRGASRERTQRDLSALATFALVALPTLAMGGVHTPVIIATGLACAATLWWARRTGRFEPRLAVALVAALGLLALLQTIPLPFAVTRALSPAAADVWKAAYEPIFGHGPGWIPLSIDPAASLLEATKWLSAAVVLGLAAHVGRKQELTAVARVIAGAAALVAIVTLTHGAAGAEQLYGFYEPDQNPARWATAPLLNPNNLAGYLNLGVFAALSLLLSTEKRDERIFATICTALLVGQVLLTGSRGGVLALGFGALIVTSYVFGPGSRKVDKSARILLLVGVGAGILTGLYSATTGVWADLTAEGVEKLTGFEVMLSVVADYPLVGTGAGAFEGAFAPHQPPASGALYSHPENFVLAWLTDFGLPLGGATLLLAFWVFRPSQLGPRRSLRARVLATGVFVFLLQNLGDLALSTLAPLLLVATALGGLVGAARSPSADARTAAFRTTTSRTLVVGWGLLFVALAMARPTSAYDARIDAHRAVVTTNLASPAAKKALLAQLHEAMLEHPGDPYLPLLVARVEAAAPNGAPFRWIGLALRRNPQAARAYLLLSDVLSARGATSQAMSAARRATISDASVAHETATRLLRDRRPTDDWIDLVPEGELGATVLREIAIRLPPGSSDRARLLDTASNLAPRNGSTLEMTANEFLGRIETRQAPCSPPAACIHRVKVLLEQAQRLAPDDEHLVPLSARRLAAAGQPNEAAALLAAHCSHADVPCLRTRVLLAGLYGLPLTDAGEALTAAVCHEAKPCADAHRWLAGMHESRREPGSALAHLESAAGASHLASDWLAVADLATSLNERARAERALRQVILEADPASEDLRRAKQRMEEFRTKQLQ